MIDALISGSAARAVFIQGAQVHFIEAENPEAVIKSTLGAVPYLLEGATDVKRLKVHRFEDSYAQLLSDWQKDRALRMLQIVLAADDLDDMRDAAEYLNDLLGNEGIETYALSITFALPFEHVRTFDYLDRLTETDRVYHLVKNLIDNQPFISIVRTEFEKVRFKSAHQKFSYEQRAVEEGVFYHIARAVAGGASSNDAVLHCLKAFSGLPDARQVVQFWTSTLLERTARKALKGLDEHEYEEQEEIPAEAYLQPRDRRAEFDRVVLQKNAIIDKLIERDYAAARRFANQLIERQLTSGGGEYAAKSLSSLATEARHMGLHDIELEWASWAVDVQPEDAWARALLADTYLSLYRFQDAQAQFKAAIAFGELEFGTIGLAKVLRKSGQLDNALAAFADAKVALRDTPSAIPAWVGHCETLRDMWRFEDALTEYEEARKIFPDGKDIWLGRAAVLKDFGQLDEAASAYSDVIHRWPEDPVSYCGRADAIKRKGDFELAIALYSDAIKLFPHVAIAHAGLADVHRSSGSIDTALKMYKEAIERFPFESSAYSGFADTLRDSGQYKEAIEAYRNAITKFPLEPRLRSGYANALKLSHDYEGALQAFDENVKDFPYDLYSLSGRANLLKLLGHYTDAIQAYDLINERRPEFLSAVASKASILIAMRRMTEAKALLPTTAPHSESEWLLYHVRGMFELRSGNLAAARDIFQTGLYRTPYFRLREGFRSALALTEIKAEQFSVAEELLKVSEDPLQKILLSVSYILRGDRPSARGIMEAVNDNIAPKLSELRSEMLGLTVNNNVLRKYWLIEASEEAVLQAAA